MINLAYYTTLSRTGYSSAALLVASKLGDVLTNAAFLALLLVVSLGWSITRHSLTRREMQVRVRGCCLCMCVCCVCVCVEMHRRVRGLCVCVCVCVCVC